MIFEISFLLSLLLWLVFLLVVATKKIDRKPFEISSSFTLIFITLVTFFTNVVLPISEGRGINFTNLIGHFFLNLWWLLIPVIAIFVWGIRKLISSKAYLVATGFLKTTSTSLAGKQKVLFRNTKESGLKKDKPLSRKSKIKKEDLYKFATFLLSTILIITLLALNNWVKSSRSKSALLNVCNQEKELQISKYDDVISELSKVNNDLSYSESSLAECKTQSDEYAVFYSKFIISWETARSNIGKYKVVCGPVMRSYVAESSKGTPLFIDIGNKFPSPIRFQLIYFPDKPTSKLLALFMGGSLYKYSEGDYLCAMGLIDLYNGVPQILIEDISQVSSY